MVRALGPAALASLGLLAVATGCPQTIVVPDDAGAAPRDAGVVWDTGVPIDRDGGVVDPPRDGGVAGDDAGVVDSGPPRDAGPLPPIAWGQMTLPANSVAMQAIWGRPGGELYAGSGRGELLALDDASGWGPVWQDPGNHGIVAIAGTATRLFVASEKSLHYFDGDDFADPTTLSIPQVSRIEGVAVRRDDDAYVVATLFTGRGFYRFDGTQLQTIAEPTDVSTLACVTVIDSGPVFIGGNGHMFRYEAATFSEETVEWPPAWQQIDILMFVFRGIAQVGGRIFAVGSGYRVFERGADRVWRSVYAPDRSNELRAITGVGADGYAVGYEVTEGPILRFDGASWDTIGFTTRASLLTVWAENERTYYAGGFVPNGIQGIILRGTR